MSYSTRRSGGYAGQQQQRQPSPQQNVGNIGQRRPVVTNNFVAGGQLKPPAKPAGTAQQQIRPPQQAQQQSSTIQFRNQAQTQQQQTKPQQTAAQQAAATAAAQQQAAAAAAQQQAAAAAAQQQAAAAAATVAAQQATAAAAAAAAAAQQVTQHAAAAPQLADTNGTAMETDDVKPKKPFWARGGGKVTKKEKVRRRNVRLSKMLQPKNAVMILNELVKNTSYMVDELPLKHEGNQFKATVMYEGVEHAGYGRSKIQAKNTAAEAALKHYVKTNKLTEVKKDEEGNEKMDVAEDDANQSPLPWQHVASFALYKLFSSWGEDPNLVKNQTQNLSSSEKMHENKPAKKMPDNPETINPLMLINQMLPQAQFEEIGKTGNPPNVVFSFKCIVDEHVFMGTGPNKKAAKKMAAFGACNKVLDIKYPPEVYSPIY
ncbi:unnamed protein product [Psylliodes chrysocephalus]|uniref:DRBM domain-containing protein n=1 Tax=Psylliodes chrysocephalus TaxID=3402493 RepID=A0A9P0D1H4_9CUCU|nr:unnamed protein product [Psylliodes chrysocephala]